MVSQPLSLSHTRFKYTVQTLAQPGGRASRRYSRREHGADAQHQLLAARGQCPLEDETVHAGSCSAQGPCSGHTGNIRDEESQSWGLIQASLTNSQHSPWPGLVAPKETLCSAQSPP